VAEVSRSTIFIFTHIETPVVGSLNKGRVIKVILKLATLSCWKKKIYFYSDDGWTCCCIKECEKLKYLTIHIRRICFLIRKYPWWRNWAFKWSLFHFTQKERQIKKSWIMQCCLQYAKKFRLKCIIFRKELRKVYFVLISNDALWLLLSVKEAVDGNFCCLNRSLKHWVFTFARELQIRS